MTPSKAPIRMLDYSRCMAAVATDSVDIVDWGIGAPVLATAARGTETLIESIC